MGDLLRVVPKRLRTPEPWLLALAFAGIFFAYSALVQPVVQNGDAAVYTEQVQNRVLDERTIHIGYVLLGIVFHKLLPLQIDRAMNFMALAVGLAGAAALYGAGRVLGSWWAGVGGVLLLLCSGSYVRGMVMSEVDILSAGLVMVSYALYVGRLTIVAGLVFGAAMLATPVSASMLPLFVFTFRIDGQAFCGTIRRQFLRVLPFGLVALAVYLPVVLWHWNNYVYGGRSLTTSSTIPFDAMKQVARGAHFFMTNSGVLIALYATGIVSALTDKRLWRLDQPAIGLVLSVILTTFAADRTADVPVHLPSLAVLSLLTALFLYRVSRVTSTVWVVPVTAFALMGPGAYQLARRDVDAQLGLRARYQEIREQGRPLRVMLVGFPEGFTRERFFEHYAYGVSYTGLVPTIQEFRSRLKEVKSGPEEYAIYFVHNIPGDVQRALDGRYEQVQRRAAGATFRVLTPRSAH
jgi:hypothetical protein